MCRSYTVRRLCPHPRLDIYRCRQHYLGNRCNPVPVSLFLPFICEDCEMDLMENAMAGHLKQVAGDLHFPTADTLIPIEFEKAVVEGINLCSTKDPSPDVRFGPLPAFTGAMPDADLEFLTFFAALVDKDLRLLQAKAASSPHLLKDYKVRLSQHMKFVVLLHMVIELAGIRRFETGLRQKESAMLCAGKPQMFQKVDYSVLDVEDQRCHVCLELFEGGEDQSVRLPCNRRVCIEKSFYTSGIKCPFCRTTFDPRNYDLGPPLVLTPWWIHALRGESMG